MVELLYALLDMGNAVCVYRCVDESRIYGRLCM